MPPFIRTAKLTYAYGSERREPLALRGVDLNIERGEYVALIGSNGSGKTTLARHLNGLLLPSSGQVWVDGFLTSDASTLPLVRQRVAMVFQNPDNQLVASTVEEDVAFGLENQALPPEQIRSRVDGALSAVGLLREGSRPPHMLSGGQKQLVAIAGALAVQPACIVFDEPTSMLDPGGCRRVLATIAQLNTELDMTVLLITQSMEEAAAADRVLVMHAGRIVVDGRPPEIFGQAELLRALGLDLPIAAQVAERLRAEGVHLPTGLLTVEDVAEALC